MKLLLACVTLYAIVVSLLWLGVVRIHPDTAAQPDCWMALSDGHGYSKFIETKYDPRSKTCTSEPVRR